MEEKLKMLEQQEEEDSIANSPLKTFLVPKRPLIEESVTPEFLHSTKRKISIDKSIILNENPQNKNIAKISDQDSISAEKILLPFWNESCKNLSSHLWLHTRTDSVDSDPNSINPYVNITEQNLGSC